MACGTQGVISAPPSLQKERALIVMLRRKQQELQQAWSGTFMCDREEWERT